MNLNYQQEVLKINPTAKIFGGSEAISVYAKVGGKIKRISDRKYSEEHAWESAYNNLTKSNINPTS